MLCGGAAIKYPPRQLVVQLAAKLAPALVEDGAIQAGLLFHLLAVGFGIAFAGLGHIPYLQIFDAHDRVVLADGMRSFVQIVLAGIADVNVDLGNFGFRLFPVLAELHFSRYAALIAFQLASRGDSSAKREKAGQFALTGFLYWSE